MGPAPTVSKVMLVPISLTVCQRYLDLMKFRFSLIQILTKWSLPNPVQDTTVVLSSHVENFSNIAARKGITRIDIFIEVV